MKRLAILLALPILLSLPACTTAKALFGAAQAGLERYRLYLDTDGDFDSATNMTYAYVDGTGKVTIGIMDLATGAILLQYPTEGPLEGTVAKGWKLIWDDLANEGKGAPKVVEVPIAEAKAALSPPPPPPVVPTEPTP